MLETQILQQHVQSTITKRHHAEVNTYSELSANIIGSQTLNVVLNFSTFNPLPNETSMSTLRALFFPF
jgi:hypothetical protein